MRGYDTRACQPARWLARTPTWDRRAHLAQGVVDVQVVALAEVLQAQAQGLVLAVGVVALHGWGAAVSAFPNAGAISRGASRWRGRSRRPAYLRAQRPGR